MRIKRFQAPDMRTALRMVRDEQGPDAVILSNRATANGIEVVAATDYDESLMSQALRAAAPGIETSPSPVVRTLSPAEVGAPSAAAKAVAHVQAAQVARAPSMAQQAAAQVMAAREAATREAAATVTMAANRPAGVPQAATASAVATAASASREPGRETLISRARAIFRIGDAPATESMTLAELVAPTQATPAAATATVGRQLDICVDDDTIDAPVVFEIPAPAAVSAEPIAAATVVAPVQNEPAAPEANFESLIAAFHAPVAAAPAIAPAPTVTGEAVPTTSPYAQADDADYLMALSTPGSVIATPAPTLVVAPRSLQAVPASRAELADPSIAAMRQELASMRALMEKQLETLSLERLRGSPARAAVLDAMLDFGCDDAMAQSIAAAIDPRLAGDELQAALAAQFVHASPALHAEPIDDGGVIALVGPTGAGKTTVAAKLAARFAARHRARDVALVSVDRERTGAREQLHAHGRRLGVTVCDAESADELGQALDQLVDYPLVLVDTTGYGVRDRALLRQILWLRSSSRLRSLLVLPANANPHDLAEIARRYRPAAPLGVVLTKLDETGRAGAALSVLAQQGLPLAYTSAGQQIPQDLQAADPAALAPELAPRLEKTARAAVNPLATEDRHAFA